MRCLKALLCCLTAVAGVVTEEYSDLFYGSEYVFSASADSAPGPVNQEFQKDVLSKFEASDSNNEVLAAKKSFLDCTNLMLRDDLETLTVTWQGRELTAVKKAYDHYPALQDRHTWIGELVGDLTGTMTVVWNSACDADVFHLSVVLNNDAESNKYALKSVACSAADAKGCTWIVKVKGPARDELEHHDHHRQLLELTETNETVSMDAHIRELANRHRPATHTPKVAAVEAMDSGVQLKVLWMYTPKARAVWGDEKIKSIVSAGVTTANVALRNSNIDLYIVCAGIFAIQGYDTNSHIQTLDDVTNGRVPGVHAKRDQYKADLVQIIIEDGTYCGFGHVMTQASTSFAPYGYSTVYSQCFSYYSHVHEILHNMGALHDKDSAGGSTGDYPYSYGWRYCNNPSDFRSVMSYSCNLSTRVPYISDPRVYYMGRSTGTAEANNAEVIRRNKAFACNFRQG